MTDSIKVLGINLDLRNGGSEVRMSLDGNDTNVWSWPRISSPSFPTMGEQLAQALAAIDGTFVVIPRRLERTT